MPTNQEIGNKGEKIVCKIPCPNCKKKLVQLPKNYPLYDVQCSGCSFRAQVKTMKGNPKGTIAGAGWDIMEKVLKSGFLIPPLFAVFVGDRKSEIRFYPFVPKENLKKFQLSKNHRQPNYKMFSYIKMDELPCFTFSGNRFVKT